MRHSISASKCSSGSSCGSRAGGLHPDTRLADDVGLYGDAGYDFLMDFAEEFHVNLEAFNFNAHFGAQLGTIDALPSPAIQGLYGLLFPPEDPVYTPVTLRDLSDWAAAGTWKRR